MLFALYLSNLLAIATSASIDNWRTLWRDDFNGAADTAPPGWRFDTGNNDGWGNNEIEFYTQDPSNVGLDGNGNLMITPRRDASGNWTSARMSTDREDFRPPPGGKMAIEGRLILPNVTGDAALGYWPAFWALGSGIRHGKSWPGVGDVDIMENTNGLDKVWGVLHCGKAPGGPCHETTGLRRNRSCPNSPCTTGFHVYRFEWDESSSPKEFRWYVDGQQYNKVTRNQIGKAWDSIATKGFFILLDVAMGGNFPDSKANTKTPTSSTEPGHSMIIDYVAVYTST